MHCGLYSTQKKHIIGEKKKKGISISMQFQFLGGNIMIVPKPKYFS